MNSLTRIPMLNGWEDTGEICGSKSPYQTFTFKNDTPYFKRLIFMAIRSVSSTETWYVGVCDQPTLKATGYQTDRNRIWDTNISATVAGKVLTIMGSTLNVANTLQDNVVIPPGWYLVLESGNTGQDYRFRFILERLVEQPTLAEPVNRMGIEKDVKRYGRWK